MTKIKVLLLLLVSAACAQATPEEVNVPAPNRRFVATVQITKTKTGTDRSWDEYSTTLHLRDQQTGVETYSDELEANSLFPGATLAWSPNSHELAVSFHSGKFGEFFIYRVKRSGDLDSLAELPIRPALLSKQPRHLGGQMFLRWTSSRTFQVQDTATETLYTFRISKQAKLKAIASRPHHQ